MSAVAERYAAALFEVGDEAQAIPAIRDGLAFMNRLLTEEPSFCDFLRNPDIALDEKATLLRATLGRTLAPLTQQFLLLLIRKQRIAEWSSIHAAFEARYRQSRKLERAVVRSARPLEASLLKRIDAHLERWRGTSIDLTTEVDPQLLGGIQVRIGSLLVDGSLRSQLDTIAQILNATPVN